MEETEQTLIINPIEDLEKIKALASQPRIEMLDLLRQQNRNVNELARAMNIPQSTAAAHLSILEKAGLLKTVNLKGKKALQKICAPAFKEILIQFPDTCTEKPDFIEVEMPVGIFTDFTAAAPCGLCSEHGIIGLLDVPDSFYNPERMKAGLLWCTGGRFEYKFPNNTIYQDKKLSKLEVMAELSSEAPGTNPNWPSDITVWINKIPVATWTCPGDFGDRRGAFTPEWWKNEGSQYGILKRFSVTEEGSFIDDERASDTKLSSLNIPGHHSIRVAIGIQNDAKNQGGMNIFGKGFGDNGRGIVLRSYFE